MSNNDFLAKAERKVFRVSFEDGFIDIGIAAFTLMFAIAPLLSVHLGDLWSTVIFLPFWGLVYLLLRWARKRFVAPRIGRVTFGSQRKDRLRRGGLVMLVLNLIFLVLGVTTFFYHDGPGWLIALRFSAIMLVFFSVAAYFYDLPQLYLYGVLIALSIPIGEWLWQRELASHHGYPLMFGLVTLLIFLRGLYKFIKLIRKDTPNLEEQPNQGEV